MEKGRITADELSQRLVGARKVMRKVDNGEFEKGSVNKNILKSPEELMEENVPSMAPATESINPNLHKAPRPASEQQIRESKLPDAIKQAMIDSPITQIGLNDTLDMKFVEKTRKLMENDGVMTKRTDSPPAQRQVSQPPVTESKSVKLNMGDLERRLTPIIENVIRKTLDEIVDRKLNVILSASQGQTINENLAIKVGETIFTGKITKAKSVK